jgi:hypothetical protein
MFRPCLAYGCFEKDAISHGGLSKSIAGPALPFMFGYILCDHRNPGPREFQRLSRHAQRLVSFLIKQEGMRTSDRRFPAARAGTPAKSSNGLPITRTFYQDIALVKRRGCALGMHRATDSKHSNHQ